MKHMTKRVLSVMLCVCLLLPVYSISSIAVNDGRNPNTFTVDPDNILPLPTELEAPIAPEIGHSFSNYSSNLTLYCATPDSVLEFVRNTQDWYYGDENAMRPEDCTDYIWTVYGKDAYYFATDLQVDFKFDNGDWQYNADWDTRSYSDPDAIDYETSVATNAYNELNFINSYTEGEDPGHLPDSLADFAVYFNEETDLSSNYYTFDSINHTVTARCRYICTYEEDGETKYITSPWSVEASYGKDASANANRDVITEATSLSAPVLSAPYYHGESGSYTYLCFNIAPAEDVKKALYFEPASCETEALYDGCNKDIHFEASLDGVEWLELSNFVFSDETRIDDDELCLENFFELLYPEEEFSWDGSDIYIRVRYSIDYQKIDGPDCTVLGEWSAPLKFELPIIGRYSIDISHEVTGSAAYDSYAVTTSRTVKPGTEFSVNCTPVTGCYVSSVVINNVTVYDSTAAENTIVWDNTETNDCFLLGEVNENYTIVVTYAGTPAATNSITVNCPSGGTCSLSEGDSIENDGNIYTFNSPYAATFTVNADDYHVISAVKKDGVAEVLPVGAPVKEFTVEFEESSSNHTIDVEFTRTAYSLSLIHDSAQCTAAIVPATYADGVIPIGVDVKVTYEPLPGFIITDITVDGESVDGAIEAGEQSFSNFNENHTVSITTEPTAPVVKHNITVICGDNGVTSVIGTTQVNEGDGFSVDITPNTGYTIDTVKLDGVAYNFAGTTCRLVNVTSAHTIEVTFKAAPTKYKILISTAGFSCNKNEVSPLGEALVNADAAFTVNYTPYYPGAVEKITVDGVDYPASADGKYTFDRVCANHTVVIVFRFVPQKGDLNKDGLVTTSDARIALRLAARLSIDVELTEAFIIQYGDVSDADARITTSDARRILRVAAKLESFE